MLIRGPTMSFVECLCVEQDIAKSSRVWQQATASCICLLGVVVVVVFVQGGRESESTAAKFRI